MPIPAAMPILQRLRASIARWLGRWAGPAQAAEPLMLSGRGSTQAGGGEIREGAPRSVIDWTPDMIKAALSRADGGSMRAAADLCDDIFGDDRAGAVLTTRSNALFASPLTFEASGDGRRKKRAVHALEAEEDWWTLFPEEELAALLHWGWVLGVGLGELVPPEVSSTEVSEGKRYVPTLKVWHPRALRFDWPSRRWLLAIEGGTEIEITAGDGRWILFTPYGRNRPWSRGLWRGMSLLRLLKRYAIADWGLHSEVHGNPIRVITSEGQVSPAIRKALANDLRDLGRDTLFACPPGFDFKMVEATAKTWEMYQAQIQLANTSYSVQAIGANLPTELTANVGTGATAQHLVRQDYKRSDAMTVSTMTRWQALVWWAAWNFGDRNLAPWALWNTEPPEDKQATALTWKTVGEALGAFAKIGQTVEPKLIEERFGIVLKAAPELLPPPPPVPPGQPGGPPGKDGEPAAKTKTKEPDA